MKDEASYVCEACGKEIVVPVDVWAGAAQAYVEDGPVCCRPNVIHAAIENNGAVRVADIRLPAKNAIKASVAVNQHGKCQSSW